MTTKPNKFTNDVFAEQNCRVARAYCSAMRFATRALFPPFSPAVTTTTSPSQYSYVCVYAFD